MTALYSESHPSWVRGLKQKLKSSRITLKGVAPLVGAWIETSVGTRLRTCWSVAPLVGAWIETHKHMFTSQIGEVAPLVGAWIETEWQRQDIKYNASHPSWVRGLKLKML